MTRLQWDLAGSRRFQAGVDRGVLYPSLGAGVPWNGLTSITTDDGGVTVEGYYLDGVKYADFRTPGEYGGTLKAITYPDEFLPYDGESSVNAGIFAMDQPIKDTFGLCYRTKIGNDQSDLNVGYKLHLLYNLTAKPETTSFNTLAASTTAEEFSWSLTGVPIFVPGFRPTCHFVIDSTGVYAGAMTAFEDYLYGNATGVASLPNPNTLSAMMAPFAPT